MSLLYRVLYAAHCNGTHHKIAMRALQRLQHPQAEAWRRVFLKHADQFIEGSKAPDKLFKDFTNHVLHVEGTEWGGAKRAASSAYQRVVMLLQQGNWAAAAYAAGVLSHYYSDPLMPFHTGSSEAENNLHRAVEWSISKSFEELWASAPNVGVIAGREPGWVEAMVRDAADASHSHYFDLISDYDLDAGVSDPPKGLTGEAWSYLPPLLAHAVAGFALLMDRAIEEAQVQPPQVSLSVETVVASLQIPVKWVVNRMEDAKERDVVSAMHAELTATGVVETHLPEEVKVVRKAIARRSPRSETDQRTPDAASQATTEPDVKDRVIVETQPAPAPQAQASASMKPDLKPDLKPDPQPDPQPVPQPQAETAPEARPAAVASARGRVLSLDADIVDAPSIGPKTAAKLNALGLYKVRDLLDCNPADVADALNYFRTTEDVVAKWRDQARLLTEIPRLRQSHAVMLVHAGYRTLADIRTADPSALTKALAVAAESEEMQRQLRNPNGPEPDVVSGWIDAAGTVKEAA
ncbi:MAG: DUF4332 domain-containing protein [Pseudomonadota bacterium]